MIRVNPRQASLRPPEITSFQILAPVGVGWGRSPECTRTGNGNPGIAGGLDKDLQGIQPLLPPVLQDRARGSTCSHPTLLAPGMGESPGTSEPSCGPCSRILCSVHLLLISSSAYTLLPPSCPAASVLFSQLFPGSPQPLRAVLSCGCAPHPVPIPKSRTAHTSRRSGQR